MSLNSQLSPAFSGKFVPKAERNELIVVFDIGAVIVEDGGHVIGWEFVLRIAFSQ